MTEAQAVRRTSGELLRERGQFADDVVAVKAGDKLIDLHTPVDADAVLTPIRRGEPLALDVIRN